MNNKNLQAIEDIVSGYKEIKLVYFFGSKVVNKDGPLSDYDFAVYFKRVNVGKMFKLKFILMDKISRLLKTDKVDIVILNLVEAPELKYQIIKEGKLIFEKEPFKVLVEPRILNEYFDFHSLLKRYSLTRA